MAQIRPYIAQVSPQAEIPTRNAQPSDIGGPGVEHLGQSIQQAGYHAAHAQQLLQHQADQQAIRKAHLDLAKIQADTTTDFATFSETVDPSNTNVHGTFWHGGAKEGEVPPNSSPAYKLQWLLDGTQNDAAKAVVQQGAASLSQQFLDRSVSLQVHLAGVAAQQDTNKYVDLQSTRTRVAPGDLPLAIHDMRTYIATLPVNEGVKMQLQNQATEEITKNAVYGVIQQAPELALTKLESGDWQGLKQEDRQALMKAAGVEISGREADRLRKEAEVERKKRIVSENLDQSLSLQESSSHELNSQVKPVSWTDIKEAGYAGLDAGSQQRWQSKLLERASRLNTGEVKTDIGTKLDLFKRMGLPPGDPRKLTDSAEIDAAYLKRRLSDSDHDWLAKKFYETKSPDGDKLATDYGGFYKRTEQLITKPGPFGIYADPSKGLWLDKFIADTDLLKQQYIKQGKDPRDLINPTKPEYRGRPEVLKDYTSSAFGELPTYPQIQTGPENFGLREDGTPKGLGYYGKIPRSDNPSQFSTELSATGDLKDTNGKPVLYPLLVPGLSRAEIDTLVSGGKPTAEIYKKAEAHAAQRIKAGKSPFAGPGEQQAPPRKSLDEIFGIKK